MRIIGPLTLVLLFLSNVALGQPSDYEEKCAAIVQGQTAAFILPLPKRETWTWNMKETKDNYQEYTWEISLTGTDSTGMYNFGVYLFKFPKAKEVTGNLTELISDAQLSVWDNTNSVQQDLKIEAVIEHDNLIDIEPAHLIIKITDKKTFTELFANHPAVAHCKVKTPYTDINFKSKTQIEYKKNRH